jgi:hypothetical protein
MSTLSFVRRAGTAVVASALAVSLVGAATGPAEAAPTNSPAGHGATWLAGQLNKNGLIYNRQFKFADYGLTADTVLALKTIGRHKSAVMQARRGLAKHVDDYTTFKTDRYAGPTAKLLVVAQQTGGKARNFGGVNLVHRLAQRVATAAPITGRIEDKSASGDFANTIGQIFAVRGLLKAGNAKGETALSFLLKQQCSAGYFRLEFNPDKTSRRQGCTPTSPADTDATALAVVELAALAKGHRSLSAGLGRAIVWLRRHQKANGSFGGGATTSASNTNSTGLAGWAFLTDGVCGPARDAAGWVHRLQVRGDVSGTPLAGEKGAIAYDRAAMKAAKQDGITKSTRDQWRRASAQAAPALLALTHCGP